MPYLMPAQRMAFFFSPKSGGTSLRAFLFHAENGFPFRDYTMQGVRSDLGVLVRNNRFGRINHHDLVDFRRFALIRDPGSGIRFNISCPAMPTGSCTFAN